MIQKTDISVLESLVHEINDASGFVGTSSLFLGCN